jgi:hypothetical protein
VLNFAAIPITPTPNLIIQGHVLLREWDPVGGGNGLPRVRIYALVGPVAVDQPDILPEPVAITDENGFYKADLGAVPAGTAVRVWAEREGYAFKPEAHIFRHEPSPYPKVLKFVATPITPPPPGLTIEGHVWLKEWGGQGLPKVRIYRSGLWELQRPDHRRGILIAVTDEEGYYKATIDPSTSDRPIWIWAVREGFGFKPRFYLIWPHKMGVDRAYNFVAYLRIRPWFVDVSPDDAAAPFVDNLSAEGYMAGCGNDSFCLESSLTREEMAVLLTRGVHGPGYVPAARQVSLFQDAQPGYWGNKYADQLYEEGLTAGCETGRLAFCFGHSLTRAQLAVFILKLDRGQEYVPTSLVEGIFADMEDHWAQAWVEEAYQAGLFPACSEEPLQACPDAGADRALAAYMMAVTANDLLE